MVPQDDCLWKVELYGIRDALWQENNQKFKYRRSNVRAGEKRDFLNRRCIPISKKE